MKVFLLMGLLIFGFGNDTSTAFRSIPAVNETVKEEGSTPADYFLNLLVKSDKIEQSRLIRMLRKDWRSGYPIMALEVFYFSSDRNVSQAMIAILEEKTGQNYGFDASKWYEYLWSKPEELTDDYHLFKAKLHSLIDSRFRKYFAQRQDQTTIRFDEIRWGGVKQDGIPPLRQPKMISAEEAVYLNDGNIVFGIAVNGDVRAYPKRILAWHEMFIDTVDDIPVAGVYCTLCGTVVLYKTQHKGVNHELGTSGFLYRSNKLMYDQATQSLWNTLLGKPVVGPLVGKDIELEYLSVVTTTWGEWKKRHPNTQVLSLDTGYHRDYGEGVAYKDYFSTDELMFSVPLLDHRLKNKESVLVVRLKEHPEEPVAIATPFLRKNPLYHFDVNGNNLVVITDKSGANRVYISNNSIFSSFDGENRLVDDKGNSWLLTEDTLTNKLTGEKLVRHRSFNAFWFGWYAAFPETKLIF